MFHNRHLQLHVNGNSTETGAVTEMVVIVFRKRLGILLHGLLDDIKLVTIARWSGKPTTRRKGDEGKDKCNVTCFFKGEHNGLPSLPC